MHNCLPTSSYSPTPPTPAPARKATQTILPQNGREKNKLGRNSQFSFAFLLCSVPSVRFPLIYTKKKIRDIRWRVVKNIPALSRQNFPSSSSSSSPIPKLGKTPARQKCVSNNYRFPMAEGKEFPPLSSLFFPRRFEMWENAKIASSSFSFSSLFRVTEFQNPLSRIHPTRIQKNFRPKKLGRG